MLSVIESGDNQQWNDIVKSFKTYDVHYLNGYARAFKLHGDGEPLLFYYDDGNTRAINVVIKRDIADDEKLKDKLPRGTWFDLVTPYGYGGFIVEGNNYLAVNQAYDAYCKEHGYVSEFVRFHLLSEYLPFYNGIIETRSRNIIRTLDSPIDHMMMDFEHSVRKSIKKATKAELQIEIDTYGIRLNQFLDIYYRTMDRSVAQGYYYFSKEFFSTLQQLESNYTYFHVYHGDQIISSELVIYGPQNCYSFLGGTNEDYFHLCPNNLLKFEVIKWAQKKGLQRFVLGGGYGEDDGIYKYKKGFAPRGIYNYYIGKKIFDMDKYNELVEIRKAEEGFSNTAYFPLYRG